MRGAGVSAGGGCVGVVQGGAAGAGVVAGGADAGAVVVVERERGGAGLLRLPRPSRRLRSLSFTYFTLRIMWP